MAFSCVSSLFRSSSSCYIAALTMLILLAVDHDQVVDCGPLVSLLFAFTFVGVAVCSYSVVLLCL